MKRRILSMFTAVAVVIAMLPATVVPASATGTTRQVRDTVSFHNALNSAQNGDTIQLTESFVVNFTGGNDSLVIDKSITIDGQGHWLSFRYAGILLGADVTIKDVTLGLASNVRPAIMANGHTLTLENVIRDTTNRNINLFCGGQTGGTQGAWAAQHQGTHGQIIIKGNTCLGPAGRIFAGSISTDGRNNEFDHPATVTIDPLVRGDAIGELYACGAVETPTSENDWFDYLNEVNPPFPSPGNFKVSKQVIFNLYGGKVGKVHGDTGTGGNLAQVNYDGGTYLNDSLVLSSIGSLNVRSGNLAPVAGRLDQKDAGTAKRTAEIVPVADGSCFSSTNNAPLTVAADAILGLQQMGNLTVGNFSGGGSLVLGVDQTLTVSGTVSESTTVGIGNLFDGHSTGFPVDTTTYINAVSSTDNSFTLAAPASRPDFKLVRSENGAWTVAEDQDAIIVNDFDLISAVVTLPASTDHDDMTSPPSLPFENVKPDSLSYPFAGIFESGGLGILVDGVSTTLMDDGFDGGNKVYSGKNLWLSVTTGDTTEEALQVSGENYAQPAAGTYTISITIPAANSGTGQPITRMATLTVKAADASSTTIPVPTAIEGLVYTGKEQVGVPLNNAYVLSTDTNSKAAAIDAGSYTATVTPASGFTWEGGGTDEKEISWSIAKAGNPNPPPSLGAAAPSAHGQSDGKITGTTAEMEYDSTDSFGNAKDCTGAEITGLSAGSYYVRYKGDNNHEPGQPVQVTVPQGAAAVTGIAISSTGHKKDYKVGDPVDVTNLTITVSRNDGTSLTIPVDTTWIKNFDTSNAGTKTVTIEYFGKTATYSITVTENAKIVQSIAVTGFKSEYQVGEFLDRTTLTITATMDDGSTETIPVNNVTIGGFDSNTAGDKTVTITYHGVSTTYTVKIVVPVPTVTSISVSAAQTQYTVGEKLVLDTLMITAHMSDGSTQTIAGDGNGVGVSGFSSSAAGSCFLTITYEGQNATLTITIVSAGTPDPDTVAVTGASLNKTALALTVGGMETLIATVSPDTATNKSVTWSSSNTSAATVDASGKVTAVAAGRADITVTTEDGGFSIACTVTVTANSGGGTGTGTSGWSGGGSGGGSTTTTETTRNPGGSTTTTVTNKTTGVVTQTIRWPDGRQEKTVTQSNGSKEFDNKSADGTTTSGTIAANGRVDGAVKVSGRAVADANGGPVDLSLPKVPVAAAGAAASTIKVDLPSNTGVDVVIPGSGSTPGTVAVLVNPDGTETVLKKSVLVDGRLCVPLDGDATVKIVNNAKGFRDMGSHWGGDAVAFVTSRALFEGNGDGRFLPNGTMTRAMLVTVLHRLEDIPTSAGVSFDDVAGGQWYTTAVSWAAENQIVEGYNGSFTPNNSVTREQIAAILYRYAKVVGVDTPERGSFAGFPDRDRTSGWAREAMSWAVGAGLFSGDDRGRLNPGGDATRAEVATLLKRFVEYMAK